MCGKSCQRRPSSVSKRLSAQVTKGLCRFRSSFSGLHFGFLCGLSGEQLETIPALLQSRCFRLIRRRFPIEEYCDRRGRTFDNVAHEKTLAVAGNDVLLLPCDRLKRSANVCEE